jgi:serine/threonine protein kinase
VLVDFGIARLVDEAGKQLTRPATAIGTAAYMSPEQARGMEVGPASGRLLAGLRGLPSDSRTPALSWPTARSRSPMRRRSTPRSVG